MLILNEGLKIVSIILTAYNTESTVGRAIESLLNQTYTNLEIILIDDASTDTTLSTMLFYKGQDKRIRVLKTSRNYGPFACKNYGMTVAKGEYITFIDSDDYVNSDHIMKSFENYINERARVGYGYATVYHTEETRKFGNNYPTELHFITSFFGRDVMKKVGFFDTVRFNGDQEFFHRLLAAYGQKVRINSNQLTYHYVKRVGSLTCNHKTGMVVRNRNSKDRGNYVKAFTVYHNLIRDNKASAYMEFPPNTKRKFRIRPRLRVLNLDLSTFEEIE